MGNLKEAGNFRRKSRGRRNTTGSIKREIMEELATEIKVGDYIKTVEYDYPKFHLSMQCFWCEVITFVNLPASCQSLLCSLCLLHFINERLFRPKKQVNNTLSKLMYY